MPSRGIRSGAKPRQPMQRGTYPQNQANQGPTREQLIARGKLTPQQIDRRLAKAGQGQLDWQKQAGGGAGTVNTGPTPPFMNPGELPAPDPMNGPASAPPQAQTAIMELQKNPTFRAAVMGGANPQDAAASASGGAPMAGAPSAAGQPVGRQAMPLESQAGAVEDVITIGGGPALGTGDMPPPDPAGGRGFVPPRGAGSIFGGGDALRSRLKSIISPGLQAGQPSPPQLGGGGGGMFGPPTGARLRPNVTY